MQRIGLVCAEFFEFFDEFFLFFREFCGCFYLDRDELIALTVSAQIGESHAAQFEDGSGLGPRGDFQFDLSTDSGYVDGCTEYGLGEADWE